MTVYHDPDKCFKALEDHKVANPGSVIMAHNEPRSLQLGWKCSLTGQEWFVPWRAFKKWSGDRRREKVRPLEPFFKDWSFWKFNEETKEFTSPDKTKIITAEDLERMKKIKAFT